MQAGSGFSDKRCILEYGTCRKAVAGIRVTCTASQEVIREGGDEAGLSIRTQAQPQ